MEQLDAVAGGSFPQNDWRPGCPTEDLSKPCDWYMCSQVYCDAFDCNSYSVMETESPVTTCPVAQE